MFRTLRVCILEKGFSHLSVGLFLLKGEKMKQVCATCKWLDTLPFADEWVCTNEESEYADCPCDYPEKDTCSEWKGKNADEEVD